MMKDELETLYVRAIGDTCPTNGLVTVVLIIYTTQQSFISQLHITLFVNNE